MREGDRRERERERGFNYLIIVLLGILHTSINMFIHTDIRIHGGSAAPLQCSFH